MKRISIILACIFVLNLYGCRTAMDVSEAVAEKYQSEIEAEILVSTRTGVPCDYRLRCGVSAECSTVEILQPACIQGIKATIESDICRIEYEDVALDAMMLPIRGMTPADCFDQTVLGLRREIPIRYSYEKKNGKECLSLTFSAETVGYQITRILWLDAKSLDLLEGEYYLDNTLIMRMCVEAFAFTARAESE